MRGLRHHAGLAFLLLIAMLLCSAKGNEKAYIMVGGELKGSFEQFQVIDNTVFLPLRESASALDMEGFADSQSRSVFFRSGSDLVYVNSNTRVVKTGDQEHTLKFAPIWTEEEVYVPDAVYTEVLSMLVGKDILVQYVPDSSKIKQENETIISNAVDNSSGSTANGNNGSALRNPVDIIVIDPGHGGSDSGARGPGGILEKDVVLEIAGRLRDHLLREEGLVVRLTRDGDTLIPLSERPRMAKQWGADVFVSIHANGFKRMSAQGFETFFASLTATDQAAMDLAIWENQAAGEDTSASDEVLTDIEMILGDMAQTESLADSQALSELIQNELANVMKSENRGVKQAPFRVLMDSTMPAVLVEVGFLTSPAEARLITDPDMQELIVEAIAAAIIKYRDQTNARLGLKTGRSSQ